MKSLGYPGQMYKSERPLDVRTDVALVDPIDLKPTEAEWGYTEQGERIRKSKRSGKVIPVPTSAHSTYEYSAPANYQEGPKDTRIEEIRENSYEQTQYLCCFEQDVLDSISSEKGEKETKVDLEACNYGKTYWYWFNLNLNFFSCEKRNKTTFLQNQIGLDFDEKNIPSTFLLVGFMKRSKS